LSSLIFLIIYIYLTLINTANFKSWLFFKFMKLLTHFFSTAATKRPVITIIIVLLLTGFFGFMAGQAEELSTSFGGEL
mgnify:CR=1